MFVTCSHCMRIVMRNKNGLPPAECPHCAQPMRPVQRTVQRATTPPAPPASPRPTLAPVLRPTLKPVLVPTARLSTPRPSVAPAPITIISPRANTQEHAQQTAAPPLRPRAPAASLIDRPAPTPAPAHPSFAQQAEKPAAGHDKIKSHYLQPTAESTAAENPTPTARTTLAPIFTPTASPSSAPTAAPAFATEPAAAPTAAPAFATELAAAPTAAPAFVTEPAAAPTAAPAFVTEPAAAPTAAPAFATEPAAAPTAAPAFATEPAAETAPALSPSFSASSSPEISPTPVPVFAQQLTHDLAQTSPQTAHAADFDGSGSGATATATAAAPVASAYLADKRRQRTPFTHWLLIAGLMLLLVLQWLLADRHHLAQNPRWRPVVAALCTALPCQIPVWRDIDALRLLERDVRPSAQPGLLHVQTRFVNESHWAQAWPNIRVSLSDASGRQLASGLFTPAQYLASHPSDAATDADAIGLIAAGDTAAVRFTVKEPQGDVLAFSIHFE